MSERSALTVVEAPMENRRSTERIIENMREAELSEVLVIGLDKNGNFWTDINFASGANAVWLLELCKAKVMARAVKKEIG